MTETVTAEEIRRLLLAPPSHTQPRTDRSNPRGRVNTDEPTGMQVDGVEALREHLAKGSVEDHPLPDRQDGAPGGAGSAPTAV